MKIGDKLKLDTQEAQRLCSKGWVLRLVDKTQKPHLKERDYDVLGKWDKKKFMVKSYA